jgi:hypothetical protein
MRATKQFDNNNNSLYPTFLNCTYSFFLKKQELCKCILLQPHDYTYTVSYNFIYFNKKYVIIKKINK